MTIRREAQRLYETQARVILSSLNHNPAIPNRTGKVLARVNTEFAKRGLRQLRWTRFYLVTRRMEAEGRLLRLHRQLRGRRGRRSYMAKPGGGWLG